MAKFERSPYIRSQLLFCGLENEQEKANVVNLIHQLGCQVEDMNDQADDVFAMVINFQTRRDAEVVCLIFHLFNLNLQ